VSELRKKANRLAVLAFGSELLADRYEKRVAYARKAEKPTVVMSVDELERSVQAAPRTIAAGQGLARSPEHALQHDEREGSAQVPGR
jgi:hypothetical protein